MKRLWRWLMAMGLLAGLLPLMPVGVVVADDAVVTTCTEAGFDTALNTVQSTGGGTITFDCSGTLTFTGEKTITQDVTLDGSGQDVIFDGGGSTRLFLVSSGARLALNGLTLQNGSASRGGAISNDGVTTITDSTISGNNADRGGAIINAGGMLEITASTLSDNNASSWGGAIINNATLTITASTFSGNSSGSHGGAIRNNIAGMLAVTSSTFSGNAGGVGGAISNRGTLTTISSTFSGNASTFGGVIRNDGTANLAATILAGSPSGGNCNGLSVTSQGENLSDDGTCNLNQSSDLNSVDPLLGPLADNDGPTLTHLPGLGSPAIDAAASCGAPAGSSTDQRGVTRPQGNACDIGSVEVVPVHTVEICTEAAFDSALAAVQASGVGTITFECSGTLTFTSEKMISQDVTIDGIGQVVILDGSVSDRIFALQPGARLALNELTLQNANSSTFGAAINNDRGTVEITTSSFSNNTASHGAAIYNDSGLLTITDSSFSDNSTSAFGGAIYSFSGTLRVTGSTFNDNSAANNGGAIYNEGGTLESTNNMFNDNSAANDGGTIYNEGGTLESTNNMFNGNTADDDGGAIANVSGSANATAQITGDTFDGNTANEGGALFNDNGTAALIDSTLSGTSAYRGSGIYNSRGTLNVTTSTVSGNSAELGAGGIYNTSGTVTVTDSSVSDNSAHEGGGIYNFFGTVTVTNSTLSGNTANDHGGGIFNWGSSASVDLVDSTVSDNTAGDFGGGIYNIHSATLNISASTLSSNPAFGGGGIYNDGTATLTASTLSGNSASDRGGGIVNNGSLTVTSSTLSGNTASTLGGGIYSNDGSATLTASTLNNNTAANGGGIYNFASVTIAGSTLNNNHATSNGGAVYNNIGLTLTNSTLSGNTATSGGGVFNVTGTTTITSSTLSGNTSASPNGGNIHNDLATVRLAATLMAGGGQNCGGSAVTSQGENLSDDTSCNLDAAGDLNSVDPLLGALADNGGPTLTHLPGNGSLAIDGAASCPTSSDQRGVNRPENTNCDIGAVEVRTPVVDTPSVDSEPSNEGQSVIASATFTNSDGDGPVTCTVDYGDGSGAQTGTVSDSTCAGPTHTYADDSPSDGYTVTITVTDAGAGSGSNSTSHSVNNVEPSIDSITDDGPVAEGSPVTLTVTASDPGVNDVLSYAFDCDNSGDYETAGAGNTGQCVFGDNGSYTVGVQVTDSNDGSATSSTTVTITNASPAITNGTNNSPVAEGSPVTITITATDPGSADVLSYAFDCDNSGDYETDGTGNTGQCTFDDNGSYTVGVQVTDDDGGSTTSSTDVTVTNVAPTIEAMSTDGPMPQGQPVTITVQASDPAGANDPLTYAFDCDNSGDYETAGAGNQGTCTPVAGVANATIGVQVSDDDGGVTTGSVTVSQFITLCGNYYTEALTTPTASGCPSGSMTLTLPGVTATTICIHPYSGAMNWSAIGSCGQQYLVHSVPDDGPLAYCRSLWTGQLRANLGGEACSAYEQPGVIPG